MEEVDSLSYANVFNIKKRTKLAKISPMSDFMVNRSYFFIFVT